MSKRKISDKTVVPARSGVSTRAQLAAAGAGAVGVGVGDGVGIVALLPPVAPALPAPAVALVPAAGGVVAGAAVVTYEAGVRTRILQHTNVIPDLAAIIVSYAAFIGVERLTLRGHTEFVRCVAVFPDGRICSGSNDNSIKIWNREGRCLQTLQGSVIISSKIILVNCLLVDFCIGRKILIYLYIILFFIALYNC